MAGVPWLPAPRHTMLISCSVLRRLAPALLLLAVADPVLANPPDTKPAPIVKGHRTAGVYHGPVEIWASPSVRQAAGECRHGKPEGRWTLWDESGTKVAELTYRDGYFEGSIAFWHGAQAGPRLKGKLKCRGSFADGQWHGLVRTFWPDGRIRSERTYEADTIVTALAFDPQGGALADEEARKVAAADEQQDNALLDALDEYIRRWVGPSAG